MSGKINPMVESANSKPLTYERLLEVLRYDPKTGAFYWRHSGKGRKIGVEAGNLTAKGYRTICVDQVKYCGHRLAWLYVNGMWPEHEIDHKDRVKGQNAFTNLRPATRSQNQMNMSTECNNISGTRGVAWHSGREKWRAHITKDRKTHHLGWFFSKEEAIKVRRAHEPIFFGNFAGYVQP